MQLLFILLSIGLYAAILFTIGHWPLSFSKKSLLPHFPMPPKKTVTISGAPAASDAAGTRGETINRGDTIVEFFEQLDLCKAPLHLAPMIYAESAEEPPTVEIPAEFLDLHSDLESDEGSIDVAQIADATKVLRQLCAVRDLSHNDFVMNIKSDIILCRLIDLNCTGWLKGGISLS